MAKRFTKKQNFNKTNLEKVPEQSGVYKLSNKKGEIQYIGLAGAGRLQERLKEHLNEGDIKGSAQFQILKTNSGREAASLEKKLIKLVNPKQNEQHNDRLSEK